MKIITFISLFCISASCLCERTYASDIYLGLNNNNFGAIRKTYQFSEKELNNAVSYHRFEKKSLFKMQLVSYEAAREKIPHKKSYLIGVGGASILPIIGHSYIGGYNIHRGLLYTLGEGYCVLGVIASGLSGFGGNPKARGNADRYKTWFSIIHGINIFDAYRSVKRHNEKVQRLENSITIVPDIGSGGVRVVWRF